MIKKSKLLDPASTGKLSEREKHIVSDAQNAGKSFGSTDATAGDEDLESTHNTGGVIEQTVDSKAVAKFGRPGDESDISGRPAVSSKTAGVERGK
jgi:hypothetical protein